MINEYAHMCQNNHVRIGHNDSDYEPEELSCPVCRERNRLNARIDELESFEQDRLVRAWSAESQLTPTQSERKAAMMPDVERLRELVEKATPMRGPSMGTTEYSHHAAYMFHRDKIGHEIAIFTDPDTCEDNAEYYREVSPDVCLALLDRIVELEKQISEMHDNTR